MHGANLSGADMSKANLAGSDLSEANLAYTDLRGANLQGTNLKNAHFFHVVIHDYKSEIVACLNWCYQTYAHDPNLAILKPAIMFDLIEILEELAEFSPEPKRNTIQFVTSLLNNDFIKLPEPNAAFATLWAKFIGYVEGAPSKPDYTLSQRHLANIIPKL
jgi:hypothetical protein